MLKKDALGGFVGTYRHNGENIVYHIEGEGSPVLMTMGLSPRGGSYDWRYIFDCLAGAFKVYALDVLGLEGDRPGLKYGADHYRELIEGFIATVIAERTSVISGPMEAQYALKASFEHPGWFHKIMIVSPDGVRRIGARFTIGRSVAYRILHIPKLESVMYGSMASKRSMLIFLRNIRRPPAEEKPRPLEGSHMRQKYPPPSALSERRFIESAWGTSLMQAPMRLSKMIRKSRHIVGEMDDFRILRNSRLIVFQKSGELPMRKDALRFCDDAIKFLG